jgi:protein-S-isoprenylcysteine O-methyltransferase Ste14
VRHPYYAGSILYWPGLALLLNSFLGFALMLVVVFLLLVRIPYEEEMLMEAFGRQYAGYMKRTKKLIPFLY